MCLLYLQNDVIYHVSVIGKGRNNLKIDRFNDPSAKCNIVNFRFYSAYGHPQPTKRGLVPEERCNVSLETGHVALEQLHHVADLGGGVVAEPFASHELVEPPDL